MDIVNISDGRPRFIYGLATTITLAAVLGTFSGCSPTTVLPPDDVDPAIDGNRDESLTSSLGKTSGEPNDTFQNPVVAVFNANGIAQLKGTIPAAGDMDVYLLGPLAAGDRVTVDTDTNALRSNLDVSIALFDSRGRLTYNNDDRTESDYDSKIDSWVVRHNSSSYYLVITHSAFAPTGMFTGSYYADVTVASGDTVPATVQQILLLDFDGGEINSPALGNTTILPFEAGAIAPRYTGDEATVIESIRTTVAQNFSRFDVTVLTSNDPLPPAGVEYSSVFFGGFNSGIFGIAESVDLYNVDYCDDAIIYTESFAPDIFSIAPSAELLGVAIGNIAAHEAGHILGLNHVDDDTALMDDQSAADAFLFDQEFKEAPLSQDIMTIGSQDAAMLLEEILGFTGESAKLRWSIASGR